MKKRRAFEVFTLSFLDCICCGFGAVMLFYTIIRRRAASRKSAASTSSRGEVNKLEEEVLVGTRNLVVLRNTLEKTDEDAAAAAARATRVARGAQGAPRAVVRRTTTTSLARREHIKKLKADIKSLEEGIKRLEGGALDKGPPRERASRRSADAASAGTSARCRCKGKRILVLLDTLREHDARGPRRR